LVRELDLLVRRVLLLLLLRAAARVKRSSTRWSDVELAGAATVLKLVRELDQ
jgi:hypothetical protein